MNAKRSRQRAGALSLDVKTRIDADLRRRIRVAADRDDRSESAIVRRAIREYLDREKVK